ncbi:2-polyprenyl-3-methyl-6-methoxy-1,4-benzoquinone monooxygenase [Acidithiobacillus thiooxidans]|uniref:3-demethoxyubiquinol 3-hydroxylase n=1 Tax=Acidithiobacillus thiooxidans ATCC 19377 TaxID=637390 RepID=A0A543Q6U6_ACITH|nr:2-polyprenyl-3-methyl-6-methoxy-1,4-benzoquinone monooxygenase [Acidithiobacillus thiooxidans]MDX5933755.1 2-polyprenyl-3-methyl-6-methoxy-1,4-benzoquinone monooxygenase [Acidithiobacillus thiooxidans]TQN52029.1 2-nonaprenyl-3-methyl-6-methoxy-1,4-benzoquinol hydroxylase [Acidithiobacillus thiooxidans ATCC 19377]
MLSDLLVANLDNALRTLTGQHVGSNRPYPGRAVPDTLLRPWERQEAGRMMRVNHAGEVMAQALYTGQAAGTSDPELRAQLERARSEEEDHLRWCQTRLQELNSRPSLLSPIWYGAGWSMGFLAARQGRAANLGLVVAVENQVEEHLNGHLDALPADDERSRAVVAQMRDDEVGHAETAESLGAGKLPMPVRVAMGVFSKMLTHGALWI